MTEGWDYGILATGVSLAILGALVIGLLDRPPSGGGSTTWFLATATGGILQFLSVVLVTLAVPAPGAGDRPEIQRSPLTTAASILFYFSGLAAVAAFLPSWFHISGTGDLPGFGGIRFYGGALFERLWGIRGVQLSLVPFAVLGALEILAGTWLWRSSGAGGALGLGLTPFAIVFLLGYGAPYYFVVVPLRVILVALATP